MTYKGEKQAGNPCLRVRERCGSTEFSRGQGGLDARHFV